MAQGSSPSSGEGVNDREAERGRAIDLRLLQLAAGGLVGGSFIHILLGFLTWLALPGVPWGEIVIWLSALSIAAILRSVVARLWCRRWPNRYRLGARLLVATGVLVGLAWGALPLLVFPGADMAGRILVVFVIGGMSLGAMAVSGYFPPAFFALLLTAFPPLLPWFFLSGSDSRISMGAMLTAFFVTMVVMAHRFGKTVRNIVTLEFTRDELLSSLTKTRDALDSALRSRSDGVAVFDSEDRLLIWNEAFARRFAALGNAEEPKRGMPIATFLRRPEEFEDGDAAPYEENVAGRWYLVRIFRSARGHTVVIQTDVTMLKEREAALRASEDSNAAILEAALDAVVGFDHSGTILSLNDAAEPLFGARRNALIGTSIFDRLSSVPARADFIADLDRFRRSGESQLVGNRSEIMLRRHDGSVFPAEISIVHAAGDSSTRFTAFIRDIGERLSQEERLRQALEEARRSMRARSEFLVMVGHELRNPLETLHGAIAMLEREDLPESAKRTARTAREAAASLESRIDDLADYAGIDVRRIEIEPGPFDPAALVESTAAAFRVAAEARGVPIEVTIDAQVPKRVSGDAGRLRQILYNLVSNAVKFTAQGFVRISLRRLAGNEGFVVLRFEVADSGVGIPESLHARIFSPFSLADPVATRAHGGQGIGLAVAKGLVEMMNGRIELESAVGEGSRFRCDLPFLILGESPDAGGDAGADGEGDRPRLAGLRCLLVDDSEANRLIVGETLKRAGAHVIEAVSGEEALEAVARERPDIVLMDYAMPGMDGRETLRRLQAAGFEDLPAIALSASPWSRLAEDEAESHGFAAWLVKPVRREPLLSAIVTAVGREKSYPIETPPPRSKPILFDETLFRSVAEDVGPDVFGTLVESFLTEAEERRTAIRDAAARGDYAMARLNAHALKSAAGSFGAMQLAAESEILERLAGDSTAQAFEAALEPFERALSAALACIREASAG